MHSILNDKELLELCLSGNELGYRQLYLRHAKVVYNTIYRVMNDVEESEDVLQEVFVDFFAHPDKWGQIKNIEAWLKRMAINKGISVIRKRKGYNLPIDDFEIEDEGHAELLDKEWQECRFEDLEKAILQLPEIPRTIVNLYLFEDLNHDDVAATLGMSAVAVRSQYHRAKKKIYDLLKSKYNYAG